MCLCTFQKVWMSAFLMQESQWSQNKETWAVDLVHHRDLLQAWMVLVEAATNGVKVTTYVFILTLLLQLKDRRVRCQNKCPKTQYRAIVGNSSMTQWAFMSWGVWCNDPYQTPGSELCSVYLSPLPVPVLQTKTIRAHHPTGPGPQRGHPPVSLTPHSFMPLLNRTWVKVDSGHTRVKSTSHVTGWRIFDKRGVCHPGSTRIMGF